MIDVSGIEYDFLPSVLWTIGVILAGGVLLGFGIKYFDRPWSAALGAPGAVLGIGGLIFGPLLIIGSQASSAVEQQERVIVKEQLSDQGFSRVDLDWSGKTFTASVDGEYFEGLLHPVGDYKYQVLTVEEVKP